jgi:hypothetical protein
MKFGAANRRAERISLIVARDQLFPGNARDPSNVGRGWVRPAILACRKHMLRTRPKIIHITQDSWFRRRWKSQEQGPAGLEQTAEPMLCSCIRA